MPQLSNMTQNNFQWRAGVSFINAAYAQNGHIICVSNFPRIYPDLLKINLPLICTHRTDILDQWFSKCGTRTISGT